MVHSRFEWGPHHEAHKFVRGLPPVSSRHMATSLDSLRKKATATCLDSWSTMFQNEKYRGHNFLLLQNLDGGIVLALSEPLLCMACMSPFFNLNCILVSTELITQRLL